MKTVERSTRHRWIGAAVAAAALLLAAAPGLAAAETLLGRVTLYEVAEALVFKSPRAATSPDAFIRRLAHASLLGTDVVPATPNALFLPGQYAVADASSNVDLATYVGPVSGTFTLLTDTDSSRLSLDTLVVTSVLRIRGELDLTTAVQGFAGIHGDWRADLGPQRGRFEGVFLIPFQMAPLEGYWYADLSSTFPGLPPCASPVAGLCPLEDREFALGIPLTKAVVNFYSR